MPRSRFQREDSSAEAHSIKQKHATFQIFAALVAGVQGIGTIAYVQESKRLAVGRCATPGRSPQSPNLRGTVMAAVLFQSTWTRLHINSTNDI